MLKIENIDTSSLDLLADTATVSNYITGEEDKVVNKTSLRSQA